MSCPGSVFPSGCHRPPAPRPAPAPAPAPAQLLSYRYNLDTEPSSAEPGLAIGLPCQVRHSLS